MYLWHICDVSPQLFSSDRSPQSSLKSHTWVGSTHTLLLHTNAPSGHKGWTSEKKTIFNEYKSTLKKWPNEKKTTCSGILPGSVQLVKSMSSIAMCPGLLKVLEASNRMVKSWGIRPTVTSPWCHISPWLPDCHHSVVVLDPSFNSTFSSSVSETVCSVKDHRRNTHADSYVKGSMTFLGLPTYSACAYTTHTLSIDVVVEVQCAGGAGLFNRGTLQGSRAHLNSLVRLHCHVPSWKLINRLVYNSGNDGSVFAVFIAW